ncbi:unnamed protein product [Medioppia subpectinata]|uniref:Legumain n=1 Tax=Medioppia subpectinata TaxID=1979941 RepID=A0A7R9PTM5_9ACAR|nr:unnamed protein product [Medioppia subpectinata]CAG2100596.1 unnamed protein product [Medioppia subpectinata]
MYTYAKLVFYMEACHSGSMFEKLLPKDINIYVTASSGPKESTDPYTAAWLYDSEHKDLTHESLQEQYLYIEMVINKSGDHEYQHSHQYGDLSIAKLPVSQFLGAKNPPKPLDTPAIEYADNCDAIPSQDVFIYMKQKQILSAKDINEKQRYLSELSDALKGRQYVDNHLYAFHKLGVFVNICESLAQTSDADIAVNQLIANCNKLEKHEFLSIQ